MIKQQPDHRKQQPHGPGQRLDGNRPVGRRRRASGRLRRLRRTTRSPTTPTTGCSASSSPTRSRRNEETIFFQLAGNRVSNNLFTTTAPKTIGSPATCRSWAASSRSPIRSTTACQGTRSTAQTFPADIATSQSCSKATTPQPGRRRSGDRIPADAAGRSGRREGRNSTGRPAGPAGAADDAEPVQGGAEEPVVRLSSTPISLRG